MITIAGTNFQSETTALFGSVAPSGITVSSACQIQASTPAHTTSTVDVQVRRLQKQTGFLNRTFTHRGAASSLLSGMTPASFTVPPGWTLARTQDFEGTLPSDEFIDSTDSITATTPHTGSKSVQGTMNSDGAEARWGIVSIGSFSEAYLSFYEFKEAQGRLNDEMFIAHFMKRFTDGTFQELIVDTFGYSFNALSDPIVAESQGTAPGHLEESKHGPNVDFGWGLWVQWEIRFKPNTPGKSDGFLRV